QPGLERRDGRPAQQADALLAALAEHADLAASEVDRGEWRRRELADPEARRVGHLDDRTITQRDRGRDLGGAPAQPLLVVDRGEAPLDLVQLEALREPARHARRADRAPRTAGGEAGPRREPVEGPDRREALPDGRLRAPLAELGEVRPQVRPSRRAPAHAA